MLELILFGVLYLVLLATFRRLGNLIAAGGAIREWGCRASHV